MKLKINEDTMSNLIRDSLIQDYNILINQISTLKAVKKNGILKTFQNEDLIAHKRYAKAIKTTLEYYTTPDELSRLIESGNCD